MSYWIAEDCTGVLRSGSERVGIDFDLEVTDTGWIEFRLKEIHIDSTSRWLVGLPTDTAVEIDGLTHDGLHLHATHAWYTKQQRRADRNALGITLTLTTWLLELKPKEQREQAVVGSVRAEYFTVGLQSFSCLQMESPWGTVSVVGPTDVKDYSKLSGRISVDQDCSPESVGEWIESTDDLATRVLDMLSLANGRLIRWSIRRVFVSGGLHSIRLRGEARTTEPTTPLLHYLHLQPALKLAIHSYDEEVRQNAGLGIAVEWFLMNPRHLEARFVCYMTALEHLVGRFGRDRVAGTRVERDHFAKYVRPLVEHGLREGVSVMVRDGKLTQEQARDALSSMKRRVGSLNQTTLQDRVMDLVDELDVPVADLRTRITTIFRVRNAIVHSGLHDDLDGLDISLSLLRELVVRIFMKRLGYQGQYNSYLDGQKWATFPPAPSP